MIRRAKITKFFFSLTLIICFECISNTAHAQSNKFTTTLTYESSKAKYTWNTSPWSECSGACFSGTQRRTVNCVDVKGGVVPSGNAPGQASHSDRCSYQQQPALSRSCVLPPCKVAKGSSWRCSPAPTPPCIPTRARTGAGR